jgi:hypothetical protein
MDDGKPQSQAERFAAAAKALGADEDEAAFRAKLAVIARQKPKDAPEPPAEATKPKRKPKDT